MLQQSELTAKIFPIINKLSRRACEYFPYIISVLFFFLHQFAMYFAGVLNLNFILNLKKIKCD